MNNPPPSKSTSRQVIEKAAEAGLAAIPIAGGPLAVAFATLVGYSINKRLEHWLEELADAVQDLREKFRNAQGTELADLATNEQFLDAVVTSTRAAVRTHQDDKLAMLRNAVLNSALPTVPDADQQLMFLQWIDELTPSHIRLLTLLNNPADWLLSRNLELPQFAGRDALIELGLPEMIGRREFYDQLLRDLNLRGLVTVETFRRERDSRALRPATSKVGHIFVQFLRDPRLDIA